MDNDNTTVDSHTMCPTRVDTGGQSYSGVSHTMLGIGVDREKRITTCSLTFPGSVQQRVGSETHRETNIQKFKS